MSLSRPVVVFLSVLAVTQAAGAQFLNYGELLPQDPLAFEEAGITSYNLSRQDDGSYSLELQAAEGLLASCEILLGETQVATCHLPDRGFFRVEYGPEGAIFEDLQTGQGFRQRIEPVADDLVGGFSSVLAEGAAELRRKVVLDSTITKDDITHRWGKVIPVLQHALTEAKLTLRPDRRTPAQMAESYGDNIMLCPNGEFPLCSSTEGFPVTENGTSIQQCCSLASALADIQCRVASGEVCCANTNCIATGFAFVWVCNLFGRPFVCPNEGTCV